MSEKLNYDDVVLKLEEDGIMQEPDAGRLIEYLSTEYGGHLDNNSSWSENKHELKIYSESTCDGYDIFWCTEDEKPYVCQDGYYYEDYQAWSEQAIEALSHGQNVWIESHIWDDMEYDFNHELEQWWTDVYDDLHADKVDELINDGYEYEDE